MSYFRRGTEGGEANDENQILDASPSVDVDEVNGHPLSARSADIAKTE